MFPEGTAELRHEVASNKKGTRVVTLYRVTREGSKTVVEVERTRSKQVWRGPANADGGTKTVTRFEAAGLGDPAVSPTGEQQPGRCVKKQALVHSADMGFSSPGPECDGSFLHARSKRPRTVEVLVCQPAPDDLRALTFVAGKSVEYLFENNDCTSSEGLRFPK